MPLSPDDAVRLFVYGSFLPGERDHALLESSPCLGPITTRPSYSLVDLGVYPALIVTGSTSIVGELYLVTRAVRFRLDVKRECPVLFDRSLVHLCDGTTAEAYVMREEQTGGRRRIKNGDWRGRFAPKPRDPTRAAWVEALRRR
jgi:gamma-glutamylcyclotransferase (GGCT)/AIG2-like uncharacterized protein YtfP